MPRLIIPAHLYIFFLPMAASRIIIPIVGKSKNWTAAARQLNRLKWAVNPKELICFLTYITFLGKHARR